MKRVVLAAALAVGGSAVARADDSSMNPFTGESYAAFNGGYPRTQLSNPDFDTAPSAWRQSNPNGLPERVLQSYSAPGEAWSLSQPVFDSAPSDPTFKQSHPNGLTEPELQALSSEAPAWQLHSQTGAATMASEEQPVPAETAAAGSLRQRVASFFHAAPTGSPQ
jgi:hypothetical protein